MDCRNCSLHCISASRNCSKMDPNERMCANTWTKSSSSGSEQPSFTTFGSQQQKWEDAPFQNYRARIEQQFSDLSHPSEILSSVASGPNNQTKISGHDGNQMLENPGSNNGRDWDPRGMLNNLSFLEQKIHQLQELVYLIIARRSPAASQSNEILVQQQQLITADLTSIIVQLISTAGSLLPSVKHTLSSVSPHVNQLGEFSGPVSPSVTGFNNSSGMLQDSVKKLEDQSNEMNLTAPNGIENHAVDEHESKDEEDVDEGENLPPGSYEILQLEKEEILAPHTHFCTICGKGFKRDANLRMHMRGHGDEYKTPAALAKPNKESTTSEPTLIKRYSCPFAGCKRNKDHKKFQPLKTILCVKNHYKRTHCDKSYTCSRCHTKKFSVIADLKTHEKHCGRDKWLCSCGTTFSRKDKLFGHIALFQGHTPAIPLDDSKGSVGPSDAAHSKELANKGDQIDFTVQSNVSCGNGFQNSMDGRGSVDDPSSYFSPLSFDSSKFPRPPFEDSESSFSFLLSGLSEYAQKTGRYSGSGNLD